ncbi:ABC transporter ATP-binding protein [Herbiconiux sp. CPCC 203407]|uniref:ABC transporter ATP-binding protein n=1 Tax=Herbiconiux oxytropis TaxID=2970915 RepID=A0AA42BSN1_9MICO|nr:ABC transporter ATP-binding protein [Herbiconiux oxytropis]MCS5723709.1 ABC transporter ATP-binding protein [Herbiconiux oxytropis]MCS5725480.1 ABC transporter ATP-binding protein [Herbiconiux oxytropis]
MSIDPGSSAAPDGRHRLVAEEKARLSVRGVLVRYGEAVALDGVDLAVHDGESVAIMGPSGSGKSTLLHAMAGIISPDEGTVTLRTRDGVRELGGLSDAARSALRLRAYGFVFQQGMLIPELTAAENVAMPLLLTGTGKSAAVRHATRLLEELGLAGLEGRRIGQLSGGQAQRVAIARARATDAQIVFADEPTGALDSRTASEVLDVLLAETTAQGRALVVVTHDEDVASRCSRVVRLKDGRIIGSDTR